MQQSTHVPIGLSRQEEFPIPVDTDERGFEVHDKGLAHFAGEIARFRRELGLALVREDFQMPRDTVLFDLICALGRAPTPVEVKRERERQHLFRQANWDELWDKGGTYDRIERMPQTKVIQNRSADFPSDPREWETAPARIETRDDIIRLLITTSNQKGGTTDHPVMTTEELPWVKDSARVIAAHAKNGKVFIGGLGLGLLNRELDRLGVKTQVVAELNKNVIAMVEPELKKEMKGILELRQGDFKEILRRAITAGEQFDAISIDAFPNSAEEVNRDASGKEVIELALQALRPGGMLTFYPDSRYLPSRILSVLHEAGVPNTCIHYTVSKFNTSEFTHEYHYGDLMSVPCVIKPVLSYKNDEDWQRIQQCKDEYQQTERQYLDQYSTLFEGDQSMAA